MYAESKTEDNQPSEEEQSGPSSLGDLRRSVQNIDIKSQISNLASSAHNIEQQTIKITRVQRKQNQALSALKQDNVNVD